MCYSVIPHVERVLDDAADHLRREERQLRDKRRGDGVEVGALVVFYAARGDRFLDVLFGPRVGLVPFPRVERYAVTDSLCSRPVDPGAGGTISQEMV